jgi:hypothetical protein
MTKSHVCVTLALGGGLALLTESRAGAVVVVARLELHGPVGDVAGEGDLERGRRPPGPAPARAASTAGRVGELCIGDAIWLHRARELCLRAWQVLFAPWSSPPPPKPASAR